MSEKTEIQVVECSNQNPYVFIVGCPRSGTTLLKRLVDAHPQIAITPETHWITRYFEKRTGLTSEGQVTSELIPKLFEYHRFPRLEIARDEIEKLIDPGKQISYADFVTGIFNLYAQRSGKRLVGDKTPGYVRSIPLLHALWPEARFVHIIRDGRDVCLSMLQWEKTAHTAGSIASWGEDPVSTVALWWEWQVRLGLEGGRPLGPNLYHEIHYNSLVERPADECAALCTFLGLPYDDAMLKFHEGRTRADPGLSAKRAWLPTTPGLRDWRSQMPAEDVERFGAAAGDLLNELGYPCGTLGRSPEALEHAARIRGLFDRQPLPQRW